MYGDIKSYIFKFRLDYKMDSFLLNIGVYRIV